MTRPLRIQYPHAYYHVTCRGNERREIFRGAEDREDFLRLLARSVDVFDIRLLAYALLPNHFHLLLCTPQGNLSEFMRHFNISYTGSYNRKYHRSGHLYQGRYQAFLIDKNNYLLEVSRYVHLNPLRIPSTEPQERRWQDLLHNDATSLPGYHHEERRKPFVYYKTILEFFSPACGKAREEYIKFVLEGLGKDLLSPLLKGKGTGIVGAEDFLAKIKKSFPQPETGGKSRREQPALRELDKSMTPDELIDRFAKLTKLNREELTRKGRQSPQRAMLMELLYRFCKIAQPQIGKLLGGIDYSAVSQARKRLLLKMAKDPEAKRQFHQMQKALAEMS